METELAKKVNKGDIEKVLKAHNSDEAQFKKLNKAIIDLQQQFEQAEETVDKKVNKMKKELDINVLLKHIKQKADEENVQKGFENVDSKINTIAETLQLLKKEIDQSSTTLQKISVQTYKFNDNASLATKPILPQNCLSCGNTTQLANTFYNVILLVMLY